MLELFRRSGFRCMDMHMHERQVENRAKALTMDRRWIQAVFIYTGREEEVPSGQADDCHLMRWFCII